MDAQYCTICGILGHHACDNTAATASPTKGDPLMTESTEALLNPLIQKLAWPESSVYFDKTTIDVHRLKTLLTRDSQYSKVHAQQRLDFIDVRSDSKRLITKPISEIPLQERLTFDSSASRSAKIFFVSQQRRYFNRKSFSFFDVDAGTWLALLSRLSILPSFLETLHSNNGAMAYQISDSVKTPVTFHLQVKIGKWQKTEWAVYAHHDFSNNQSVVLCVGTFSPEFPQRIFERIDSGDAFNIFQVLSTIGDLWHHQVETHRWGMDYDTQSHEAMTGYSSYRYPEIAPPSLEKLTFSRALHVTAHGIRNVSFGSKLVGDALELFKEGLKVYGQLSEPYANQRIEDSDLRLLQDALSLKTRLAQYQRMELGVLQARIDDQISVTKTLIAHRDTELNIIIAKAAKRDSELMRSIAAVTMVFFPATFFATFFSMAFFHVGDENSVHLMVDQQVWIYPVIMIPFTAAGILWYNLRSQHPGQLTDYQK